MTSAIPSKNDAARSRDSDPLLHDIDKHAIATTGVRRPAPNPGRTAA